MEWVVYDLSGHVRDRKPIGVAWLELHGLPPWHTHFGRRDWKIWIQARPGWCDRGRWIAETDAPLDSQEGWPRYYFDLDVAKREIAAWIDVRAELKPVSPPQTASTDRAAP